jgi:DNA (cytosine-5)-methyltransferase 1
MTRELNGGTNVRRAHPELWPTPTAQHRKGMCGTNEITVLRRQVDSGEMSYAEAMQLSHDQLHRPIMPPWREEQRAPYLKKKATEGTITGRLNPDWVEWLMGYPTEWTVLRDSEMPSSHKSPSGLD